MENDNMADIMKAFIANTPEVKVDEEYFELEDRYNDLFGHRVPREMLPSSISTDMIKEAMRKCIASNEDSLLGLLDVSFEDDLLY